MAVKFIIDSAGDLIPSDCEKLGVTHLPMTIRFGTEEYTDAVTLSHQEFYEKLVSNPNHPTSSQIPPAVFSEAYQRLTATGDQVVVITLSSKLSGTYQSAVIAADEFENQVFVVDSLTATVGERVLLEYGLRLASQGLSAREIATELEAQRGRIRIFATLDTLEYLKRGGRISSSTAVVGGLLNIKPAIAVEDGCVISAGKARGNKAANTLLRQLIEKTNGIDFSMPMCLVYSGVAPDNLNRFLEEQGDLFDPYPGQVPVATVGCAIGSHVGPGAAGVIYFETEQA